MNPKNKFIIEIKEEIGKGVGDFSLLRHSPA
jgi:hypothetical protein